MSSFNCLLKKVLSKYLLKKMKTKNIRITIPNFDSSIKENLFNEIVYNFESAFYCLFFKNQPNSYNISDLTLNSKNVLINQGTRITCDNIILYIDEKTLNKDYSNFYKYPFINNPNIGVTYESICSVKFTNKNYSVVPYEIFINLTSTRSYIYYPNSYLYLLICPEPFAIYCLIYYSPKYVYSDLIGLTNELNLPTGWIYTFYQSNDYCGINCVKTTSLMTDELGNVYLYVDAQLNPDIYKNYLKK